MAQFYSAKNRNAKILFGVVLMTAMLLNTVPVTQGATADWYSGWSYRKEITIDHTKVTADLTDFPVLVQWDSDGDLAAKAQSNGHDILFTQSDGTTKLSHEIESFNSTTGALTAYVKVPSLSSTTDTVLYVYYGNAAASNQQDVSGTWDSHYAAVHHLNGDPSGIEYSISDATANANHGTSGGTLTSSNLAAGKMARGINFDSISESVAFSEQAAGTTWTKIGLLPSISGQFGTMWYNGPSDYVAYYSDGTNILRATSSDGTAWTPDTTHNPVLTPTVGQWDATALEVAQVWKEGSTWYLLYRGKASAAERKIGLATSSDGITWTKDASNPVLSATTATWEVSDGNGLDPFGIMKVGSTYYLWYNTVNNTVSESRATGLATSTDLVHWTRDANNPIFVDGRYCVTPFKYGGYYYLIVPHTDNIELYRDTSPTFYANERTYLGVILRAGTSGWDQKYLDTPSVLTTTINRDTFPGTNVQMYYTGLNSNLAWTEGGLAQYPLASLAGLSSYTEHPLRSLDLTTGITLESWVNLNTISGTYPIILHKQNAYGLALQSVSSKLYPLMELKTDLSWRFTTHGTAEVPLNGWHHVAATYDATSATVRYYVDGQAAGTDGTNGSGNIALTASPLQIQGPSSIYTFLGEVDEARISNSARSSDWIATEYANQSSPATFITLASQESHLAGSRYHRQDPTPAPSPASSDVPSPSPIPSLLPTSTLTPTPTLISFSTNTPLPIPSEVPFIAQVVAAAPPLSRAATPTESPNPAPTEMYSAPVLAETPSASLSVRKSSPRTPFGVIVMSVITLVGAVIAVLSYLLRKI